MKIVSFYEMAPDALLKVTTHYPSHRARLDEFHVRGVLLAAGPLGTHQNALWLFLLHVKQQRSLLKMIPL